MDVGAAGQDVDPTAEHLLGEHPGTSAGAPLTFAELFRCGDLQCHRLRGDHVHQWAALPARERPGVDLLLELLLAEDHAAARAAEGLVDRRADDVGVGHRAGMFTGGDQAGEVRHVDEQVGAHLVGDLPEAGEVELAGVGRPAGEDHLRPVLLGQRGDLVHVHPGGLPVHPVGHHVVVQPGEVDPHTVGEMPAVVEFHPQEGVAGFHQRAVDDGVGLGAGCAAAHWRARLRTAPWPGRWPVARPRRRARNRRSSAGPGSPPRTCWSAPSPGSPGRPGARSSPKRSSPGCSPGGRARWRAPRRSPGRPRRPAW